MNEIISGIRQALEDNTDEKTKSIAQKFFKEKIKYYGVKTSVVREIGKEYFEKIKQKPKKEIYSLCEELWKSAITEETYIACDWSYYIHVQYEPEDFIIFDKWVNLYVNNWASCDTLCNHTIGSFVMMYPEYVEKLKEWTKSENRWTKRAAAVTLIIPAKKGLFKKEIFEIAETLLLDKDDLVQKGYGWMLKATSESYQQEVFDYVMSKKAIMPRTSLRYAIEKMPKELKALAMAK